MASDSSDEKAPLSPRHSPSPDEMDPVMYGQENRKPSRLRKFLCSQTGLFLVLGLMLLAIVTVLLVTGIVVPNFINAEQHALPSDPLERARALLKESPLIDGHNDLAYVIRKDFNNHLDEIDLAKHVNVTMTDIPRLREGLLGAQFWSAYMGCSTQFKDATRTFLDQMDVINRFVAQYPEAFQFVTSSDGIMKAFQDGKIASLIGVEGGHAIDSSLATLRQLYALGARYMTLTHTCNTPWADSCAVKPEHGGLTNFGLMVVAEMNRLGMMVDISHVSADTMRNAIDNSKAPVIFSHSSALALCNNPRNVPTDVLEKLPENGGIVMVNFYPGFINCSHYASLSQVADHIDYIRKVAGVKHVGIGSDFDGITYVPKGLEDVSKYPYLFAELIRRGYSDEEVKQVAGLNLITVFQRVEQVRDELATAKPDDGLISPQPNVSCRPDF